MSFDDFLIVSCLVLFAASYLVYKWTSANVYISKRRKRYVQHKGREGGR